MRRVLVWQEVNTKKKRHNENIVKQSQYHSKYGGKDCNVVCSCTSRTELKRCCIKDSIENYCRILYCNIPVDINSLIQEVIVLTDRYFTTQYNPGFDYIVFKNQLRLICDRVGVNYDKYVAQLYFMRDITDCNLDEDYYDITLDTEDEVIADITQSTTLQCIGNYIYNINNITRIDIMPFPILIYVERRKSIINDVINAFHNELYEIRRDLLQYLKTWSKRIYNGECDLSVVHVYMKIRYEQFPIIVQFRGTGKTNRVLRQVCFSYSDIGINNITLKFIRNKEELGLSAWEQRICDSTKL